MIGDPWDGGGAGQFRRAGVLAEQRPGGGDDDHGGEQYLRRGVGGGRPRQQSGSQSPARPTGPCQAQRSVSPALVGGPVLSPRTSWRATWTRRQRALADPSGSYPHPDLPQQTSPTLPLGRAVWTRPSFFRPSTGRLWVKSLGTKHPLTQTVRASVPSRPARAMRPPPCEAMAMTSCSSS
jgi:hypothetical protein